MSAQRNSGQRSRLEIPDCLLLGFRDQQLLDAVDRLQVLRIDFLVPDADAKILFQKRHQAEDAEGIDDAIVHERFIIAERGDAFDAG